MVWVFRVSLAGYVDRVEFRLELCAMIVSVQKIELQRMASDAGETVRGHIVISLISRDRSSTSPRLAADVELTPPLSLDDPSELPEGWVATMVDLTLDLSPSHLFGSSITQWNVHLLVVSSWAFYRMWFSHWDRYSMATAGIGAI